MSVTIKRVYEAASPADGTRVLVDRLWPRGLTKERAAVQEWLRDLAPSTELRRWYHSQPERWLEFRKKYLKELSQTERAEALARLYEFAHQTKTLTLLFASKNETHNNATVLQELIEGMRKPPSTSGRTLTTSKSKAAVRRG